MTHLRGHGLVLLGLAGMLGACASAPPAASAGQHSTSSAAVTDRGVEPAAPGTSVRDRLLEGAADVAIFATSDGLVAVDDKGTVVERFAVGAVDRCYADPAADSIWLTRATAGGGREIAAIDLRSARPTPLALVAHDPVERVMVVHAAGGFGLEDDLFVTALRVMLDPTPEVELALGGREQEDAAAVEAAERAVANAQLLNPPALAELGRRATEAAGRLPALEPVMVEALPLVDPAERCSADPLLCGNGLALSGSDLAVVTVGFQCDTVCEHQTALIDTRRKLYLDVIEPARHATTSPDDVLFVPLFWSPSAGAWIAGGHMATPDGQILFEDLAASPCGWLSLDSLWLW